LAPDSGAAQNGKSRKDSLPHKSTRMSISFDKYFLSNKNKLFNTQNSLSPPKKSAQTFNHQILYDVKLAALSLSCAGRACKWGSVTSCDGESLLDKKTKK
jgi:hypothetical protein